MLRRLRIPNITNRSAATECSDRLRQSIRTDKPLLSRTVTAMMRLSETNKVIKMTVLAKTETHLAEYTRHAGGLLTIARQDGKCIGLSGKKIAGDFRDCLKTHTPQQVIDCYLKMAPKAEWKPLYKEHLMHELLLNGEVKK